MFTTIEEIIQTCAKRIGRKIPANCPVLRTKNFQGLGQEQIRTGYLLAVTTADNVFQIAAHEGVI